VTDRPRARQDARQKEWVEPWLPHDFPERPLDHGAWLDDCRACLLTLRAQAATRPRLLLCLKTDADRILVTAEYAAEVLAAGRPLEDLCYVSGDRIREVFVPATGRLRPMDRLWSLTAAEDTTAGLPVRARRGHPPDQRPGRGGLDIFRRSPTSPAA
jgi:hypothetical protein